MSPKRGSTAETDEMAEEIYDLYKVIAAARSRAPAGTVNLTETEFVTLDLLLTETHLTVGDLQKRIGVAPAQMSRVIRALEEGSGKGFVQCGINPDDRRRVNVSLTSAGTAAHGEYRASRLETMYAVLDPLSTTERREFMRILGKIKEYIVKRMAGQTPP